MNSIKVKRNSIKSPKSRILIKASELFYNQSYNGTGINQIIQESNCAKASFYDHFPSKEILGKEVIRRYSIQIYIWFRDLIRSSANPEDFLNRLEKAVNIQIKSKNSIYKGCPIAIISSQFPKNDPYFSPEFVKAVKQWEKLFSEFFEKLKVKKIIPKNMDCKILAKNWIFIYEGALITWRMSGDKKYISSMKQAMESVYYSALNNIKKKALPISNH